MRILQAALREDCAAQLLSDMACGDPAFAGRLLRWVNSPAFRRSRTVTDVRQAASLLGIRGMRTVALSMVLTDRIPEGPSAERLLGNGLRRALAAHMIAEHIARDEADTAFTVGLFLEVGLLELATTDLQRAFELAEGCPKARLVRERAAGLTPHPELGASIAAGYELPDDFQAAIRSHHAPEPPAAPLARAAWLAERVAAIFEGGPVADARQHAEAAAAQVGLAADVLEALVEMLPSMVADGAQIFERDVGEQPTFRELLLDANEQLLHLNSQYEQTVQALQTVIAEKERLHEELQRANAELTRMASHDALTGLANRRALADTLDHDLAQAAREKTTVCVAVLDLDHFKLVNDEHGHDVGDAVLRHVAQVLKDTVRESDLAARFGGEEMVLVLPNTTCAQAEVVLERVRKAIETRPAEVGERRVSVTASFGAACTHRQTRGTSQALFKAADEALYEAKRAGRNRVAYSACCSSTC